MERDLDLPGFIRMTTLFKMVVSKYQEPGVFMNIHEVLLTIKSDVVIYIRNVKPPQNSY